MVVYGNRLDRNIWKPKGLWYKLRFKYSKRKTMSIGFLHIVLPKPVSIRIPVFIERFKLFKIRLNKATVTYLRSNVLGFYMIFDNFINRSYTFLKTLEK